MVGGAGQSSMSRRTFLKTVASAGAIPAVVAGASAIAGCSSSSSSEVAYLSVSDSDLLSLNDFELLDADGRYTEEANYKLPLGAMAWTAGDAKVLVMVPGENASPLSQLKILDLDTGVLTMILEEAVGQDEGYEIYEARASDAALAWVECNYLTSDWRLYGARIVDGATLKATMLDEGDKNWDTPLLSVLDNRVIWEVLPWEEGDYTSGDSYVKSQMVNEEEPTILCTSHGRLIAEPELSDDTVTFVPRLDAAGIYYVLTAADPKTGAVVSSITLPKAVKVLNAVYMGGAFAFSIEATYSSSSAIAQMGTYYDLGDGKWLRVPKTPACAPALCNGYLIVKYAKGIAVIDTDQHRYFVIPAPGASWDYGEYLACAGTSDKVVTYATVDADSNVTTAYVQIRVLSFM